MALLRNAALSTSVQYVESMVGLALGVVIARTLGPTEYGYYAFAVWLCAWMLFAANNGLNLSAIRFIAEFRGSNQAGVAEALSELFLRWQSVCTAVVLGCFIVVALAWPPHDWDGHQLLITALVVVAVLVRARFWLLSAIGKGHERFEPESFSILGMVVANLIAIAIWWYHDRTFVGAFAIYAATGVLCYALARHFLKSCGIQIRAGTVPPQVRQRVVQTVLSSGALVTIGLLSGRVFEMGLLKVYWSAETIAYFAIAGTLTKGAVDLFAGGLATILLPVMSRAFGRSGKARVGKMMVESTRYYWFIGLMIAGLGIVITRGAVTLLYGMRYEAAVPVVTYTLVIAGLGSVTNALSAFQTASDYQTDRVWTAVATFFINAVAALALVPIWGLMGAVLSLAITRCASLVVQYLFVRRRLQVRMKWDVLFRLLFAALVACELALVIDTMLLSRFSFVFSGLVFCVSFVALSVLLRGWYSRDFALVAEVAIRFGAIGERFALTCRRLGRRFAI